MRGLAAIALIAAALGACRSDNYGLVNMARRNPRILREMRYATAENFTGRRIYQAAECWLNGVAAARLDGVQQELEKQGLGLKVWDCYRPLSVQRVFWSILPDERYVANPAKGSRHNRAAAVDLTLVDAQGRELPMPTRHDDFSPRAHRDYRDLPAETIANRDLLEKAMARHGFQGLPTEWWHFDSEGWESFPLLDVDFARLR
jgi:D-alanyl-D-alanine dipeptidase